MSGRGRRRWWRWAAVAAASLVGSTLVALAGGCRRDPAQRLPDGTLWAGDAAQATRLLRDLAQPRGTPVAMAAGDLLRRLDGCRRFVAHCPPGDSCTLASALRCDRDDELTALADEVRGDAGWVLAQRGSKRLLVARGTTRPGGDVAVHAALELEGGEAAWQALLPARGTPDGPVIGDAGALVHLRLRSDRGLASLGQLGAGGWADRLFGLEEKLLLAMDSEGTVELAVFEPAPGELIPPLAAAIHVRRPTRAVEAMESLIAEARTRWGVGRRAWRSGEAEGACLDDLNVLPELAPCYLATEKALIVGWNRRSVLLARGSRPAPARGDGSELVLALDRFPAADRLLRDAYGGSGDDPARRYPWSRASVAGLRRGGAYELDLALLAAPAAPGSSAAP